MSAVRSPWSLDPAVRTTRLEVVEVHVFLGDGRNCLAQQERPSEQALVSHVKQWACVAISMAICGRPSRRHRGGWS